MTRMMTRFQKSTRVGIAPCQNHGTVHWHGYFVLCSAQGISNGDCVPSMTVVPGFGNVPFARTVNGRMLTSSQSIESAAHDGLVTLFDTGGVFVGTINPNK